MEVTVTDKFYGQELLHTPGGVRDIYGAECASKLKVQNELHQVLNSYGFRDIQTPTFEYFDIFSKERGTVQPNAMFKFFDRGNNTLVLRPDITPSIARCVAKYDREEQMQIRLCYAGNTFVNTTPYKGKLQEVTQLGAELVNDDSSDADAEMVALTVECLLKSGLKEFQLEVGHADFLRGLVEEAGFGESEIGKLQELIESKNFFGVEELLDRLTVSRDLKEIFLKLPELLGDFKESMEFVKSRTKSERVLKALDRLAKIEQIVSLYGFSQYITIDLSMLSTYSYYTGVIFRAYTYGNGEALASGGRYDSLVAQFGKEAPAIGMCIVLDQLMLALERQHLLNDEVLGGTILLYTADVREKAHQLLTKLRGDGKTVQMMRKSSRKDIAQYQEYAQRIGADEILYVQKDEILKY
ncbi:MAG: ATP phosphoribosyltransferase regulatory subunit [Lachnospiraceae bacterium]|nr:ATP phosphoribosyltransferase regulatory subunit [Lachnospiraceae bacterium]